MWLSPVQVVVIPIGEKHNKYAKSLADTFKKSKIRVETDDRSQTMQAKVRDAQMRKIPYMLIVGDRELQNNAASVRLRDGTDLKSKPIEEILAKIEEIRLTKSLSLW